MTDDHLQYDVSHFATLYDKSDRDVLQFLCFEIKMFTIFKGIHLLDNPYSMTDYSTEQHPPEWDNCTNKVDCMPTRNISFHDHGQTEYKRTLERQAWHPGHLRSKTFILDLKKNKISLGWILYLDNPSSFTFTT